MIQVLYIIDIGSTWIRIGSILDVYRIVSGRYGADVHCYRFDIESIWDQHRFVSGRYVIDIESHRVGMGSIYIYIGSM